MRWGHWLPLSLKGRTSARKTWTRHLRINTVTCLRDLINNRLSCAVPPRIHIHALPHIFSSETVPGRKPPPRNMSPLQSFIIASFLFAILAFSNPLSPPSRASYPALNELTFRQQVARALGSIQAAYPGAELHRIECTSTRGPLRTPLGLVDVRLFFANPSRRPDRRAILLSSQSGALAWGQWDRPQYLPDPRPGAERPLGDVLTSDIVQVVQRTRQAGQQGSFRAVDVVKEEGMTEVWWQFQMSSRNEGWAWVGDESGRVMVENGEVTETEDTS